MWTSRRDRYCRALQIVSACVLVLSIARCLDSVDGEIRSRPRLTGNNVCGSSGRHCCSGWALSRSQRTCTIPRCDGACGRNGTCISPRMCRCSDGTTSESCHGSRSAAGTHVPPQMRVFRGQCSRSRRVCKHICLNLTRYLFRCACRRGYNLQPDSRSCESGSNSTSAGATPPNQTSSYQLPLTRQRRSNVYDSNQKRRKLPDTRSFSHNKDRYHFESKFKNNIYDNRNVDQKNVKGSGSSRSKSLDNLAKRPQVFSNQNIKILKHKENTTNSGPVLMRSPRTEEIRKAGDTYSTASFDPKNSAFDHEYLHGSSYKKSAEISGNWEQKYEDFFGEVEKALLDLEENKMKDIDTARLEEIDMKLQHLDKNTFLELDREKLQELENRLQDIGNIKGQALDKNTFHEAEKSRMLGQENHNFQGLDKDSLQENDKSTFIDEENKLKESEKSTLPDWENNKWQESEKSRNHGNKLHDLEESKLFIQENKWQEFDKRKLLDHEKKQWSEFGRVSRQELEKSKLLGQDSKLQELKERKLLDEESKVQDLEESKLPSQENKLQELHKDKLRELGKKRLLNRENQKFQELDKDTFLKLDKNTLQDLVDKHQDLVDKHQDLENKQKLDTNKSVNNENKKVQDLDENKREIGKKYWQKIGKNKVKQVDNSRFMESEKKQEQELDHANLQELENKKVQVLGDKKMLELEKNKVQVLGDKKMQELKKNKVQVLGDKKLLELKKNKVQELETHQMLEIEQNAEQEFKKNNRQVLNRTNLQEFEEKKMLELEKNKIQALEKSKLEGLVQELEKNKMQKVEKKNFEKDKSDYEHGKRSSQNDKISHLKETVEPGIQTAQYSTQQGMSSLPTLANKVNSQFKKTRKADFKYLYSTNTKRQQKAQSKL